MKKIIGLIVSGLLLIFVVVAMLLSQTKEGGLPGWFIGGCIGLFIVVLNPVGFNKPIQWKKKIKRQRNDRGL